MWAVPVSSAKQPIHFHHTLSTPPTGIQQSLSGADAHISFKSNV